MTVASLCCLFIYLLESTVRAFFERPHVFSGSEQMPSPSTISSLTGTTDASAALNRILLEKEEEWDRNHRNSEPGVRNATGVPARRCLCVV